MSVSNAGRSGHRTARDFKVDSAFLDALLLDFAGFTGDYIETKLQFMQLCKGRFCGQSARGAANVASNR